MIFMKGASIPEVGFLRMCIDCQFSRVYQATNSRNIWYFCVFHGVATHYNESCESWVKDTVEVKKTHPIALFPDGSPSGPSP